MRPWEFDRASIGFAPSKVTALSKGSEEVGDQWVIDGPTFAIGFEVALRHVGRMSRAVHEYVVPGCVFWRPRAGDLLVPVLTPLEGCVDVEDDTPIVETEVVNEVADPEARFLRLHAGRIRVSDSPVEPLLPPPTRAPC